MRIRLDKRQVIVVCSYCRQAERSVHFAHSNRSLWNAFIEYFDSRKKAGIIAIIDELKNMDLEPGTVPSREHIAPNSWFDPFSFIFRRVTNPFRSSWTFSRSEIAFIRSKLEAFLGILNHSQPCESDVMIDLRMDLFVCSWMIRNRACGLPMLAKADHIEHFCQSDHVEHFTLEEMGIFEIPRQKERVAVD